MSLTRRRLMATNDEPDILYLYKEGDECINVTGGWKVVPSNAFCKLYKNNNSMKLSRTSTSSSTVSISAQLTTILPLQQVFLGNYNYLNVDVEGDNDRTLFIQGKSVQMKGRKIYKQAINRDYNNILHIFGYQSVIIYDIWLSKE